MDAVILFIIGASTIAFLDGRESRRWDEERKHEPTPASRNLKELS